MIRWLALLISIVFVCTGLVGCLEEEASAPPTPAKKVASKPPAKKVPPPKAKVEEEKPPEFVYVTEGRRDPFVPLSAIKKKIVQVEDAEPETPLQKYDIVQFRLIGLIVGKGDPKAMVVAPDGKSYVLAKGVKIGKNSGVVVEINPSAVLVEEKYYDFSGNVIENIQEITVPTREGV